jgi:hypothetical protein
MTKTSYRMIAIILIAVAVIFAGFGIASAGISGLGYAQIAQKALTKAGKPNGYKTTCKVIYYNYGTAEAKILCTMKETQ